MSAMPSRIDTLRVPPFALESEQSVLGGLMLVPEALSSIADWLAAEDFYRREHRLIYTAIVDLVGRREPIDPITLGEWFKRNGEADSIGGPAYLSELANNTPSAANIEAYAEIIVEQARLRKTIEIGTRLSGQGFDRANRSEAIIAEAMHALAQLQTSRLQGGLRPARELARDWYAELSDNYDRGDAITGMPTPWSELDALTHGLQAGDLIVIAGRPNMGKTVMGLQIAAHAAMKLGTRTAFFSLEMTAKQVLSRVVSATQNIPHKWLMSPRTDESQWPRVSGAVDVLNRAPLWIDDTHGLSIDQAKARARRMHLRSKIGLLVFDHMHEFKLQGRNSSERTYELGQVADGMKGLGKEFDCPVVALAQLNRDLLSRPDKHPIMSDLRASGDIEQIADMILFLHREEYYDKKTHLKGVVDVEIGKGRNVETGSRIQLQNRFDVMRLDPWEGELPLPPAKPQTMSKKRNSFAPDPVSEAYAE